MGRRGLLFGAWALATAAATLVAWAAVRQVTEEVAAPSVLPVPSAVAIAERSEQPTAPASEPRREGRRPSKQATQPPVVVTQPPRPADSEPARPQPAAGAGDEPAEDDTAAQSLTEAYRLTGGVVTVRYRGGSTELISATPNSGFDLDVNDPGPGKVDVRFRSDDHESRLVTRWRSGAPDPEKEERPR